MKHVIENISKQLLQIAEDRTSGATQMLQNLISTIEKILAQNIDPKIFKNELIKISHSQKQFINLYTIVNKIIQNIESSNKIQQIIKEVTNHYQTLAQKHYNNIIPLLPDKDYITILTHSNSSSVKLLLSKLKNIRKLQVFQTTSRPGGEGLLQAQFFKENNIAVTIIDDTAIPLFIKQTDFAIIGCDAISNNFFVNKTGSMIIALACKYYHKPLIVLGDKYKQNNDFGEQVTSSKIKGITKKEIILEKVPISLAKIIL